VRGLVAFASLLALAACEVGPGEPGIVFPHGAAPVGRVCQHEAHGDIVVETIDPALGNGLRRFRLHNASGSTHSVLPKFVVQDTGPCEMAGYARSTKRLLEDPATCAAPTPIAVAPGGDIEVRTPPSGVQAEGACTKIGLGLYAQVDDKLACFDLGAWIARDE
jgi:hypothetical protein